MHQKRSQLLLVMPLLIMYSSTILGQTSVPQEPADLGIKCGSCPCVTPCGPMTPPPPPPPPTPPPPPPPPAPKTEYCNPPPPPPPRFFYVTNQPGNFYVADPYDWGFYNGAGQTIATCSLIFFALGALSVIMIR